jgi:hypothetical protein
LCFSGLWFVHSVCQVYGFERFFDSSKKGRNDIWSREIKKEISRMFLQKQTKTVTDGGISTELPFSITH